jgi:hypothetical protein
MLDHLGRGKRLVPLHRTWQLQKARTQAGAQALFPKPARGRLAGELVAQPARAKRCCRVVGVRRGSRRGPRVPACASVLFRKSPGSCSSRAVATWAWTLSSTSNFLVLPEEHRRRAAGKRHPRHRRRTGTEDRQQNRQPASHISTRCGGRTLRRRQRPGAAACPGWEARSQSLKGGGTTLGTTANTGTGISFVARVHHRQR